MPVIPSDEFNRQIVKTVEDYLRRTKGDRNPSGRSFANGVQLHYAIANDEIAAASDGAGAPSTGEVEILSLDTVENTLSRSGIKHTLKNRWEGVTIEQDMLLVIAKLKGEVMAMGVDCDAMASPPS
jgi:hypothetical protein